MGWQAKWSLATFVILWKWQVLDHAGRNLLSRSRIRDDALLKKSSTCASRTSTPLLQFTVWKVRQFKNCRVTKILTSHSIDFAYLSSHFSNWSSGPLSGLPVVLPTVPNHVGIEPVADAAAGTSGTVMPSCSMLCSYQPWACHGAHQHIGQQEYSNFFSVLPPRAFIGWF